MITPIITLSDVQLFKSVSDNINSIKELQPYILEAMDFDLRPFMGESFYIDLYEKFVASPSLDGYEDLFNGSTYTYNGNKYQHEGIRAVLVYHAFARYSGNANIKSTPYGMVQKTTQYSDRVSEATTARLMSQARSGAMVHEGRVMDFLNRNKEDYPLFTCKGGGKKYRAGKIIKKIG